MKDEKFIRLLSFIMSSKNRPKVLKALVKPSTPTSLHQSTKINIKLVSRALKELSEAGLVVCRTPEAKKGRIYTLTKEGTELLEHFKE